MSSSHFPHFTQIEEMSLPEKSLKLLLSTVTPAGIKTIPALWLESAGVWLVGIAGSIETITWALLSVQAAALFSQALTHGWRHDNVRKAALQVIHMWLALVTIIAFQHAKLIDIDIYSKAAGFLMAFEALITLKNLSESGVKTELLDKVFSVFLTKAGASPGPRTDTESITAWEKLQAQNAAKKDS